MDPSKALCPFSITVLLSVARIHRFEEQVCFPSQSCNSELNRDADRVILPIVFYFKRLISCPLKIVYNKILVRLGLVRIVHAVLGTAMGLSRLKILRFPPSLSQNGLVDSLGVS